MEGLTPAFISNEVDDPRAGIEGDNRTPDHLKQGEGTKEDIIKLAEQNTQFKSQLGEQVQKKLNYIIDNSNIPDSVITPEDQRILSDAMKKDYQELMSGGPKEGDAVRSALIEIGSRHGVDVSDISAVAYADGQLNNSENVAVDEGSVEADKRLSLEKSNANLEGGIEGLDRIPLIIARINEASEQRNRNNIPKDYIFTMGFDPVGEGIDRVADSDAEGGSVGIV